MKISLSTMMVLSLGTISLAQDAATPPLPPPPEDPMNPFGWPEIVVPTSLDLEQNGDWSEACAKDLEKSCGDATDRGEMFGCLLDNAGDTFKPKCIKAIQARNAKTVRDFNNFRAEQEAAAAAAAESGETEEAVNTVGPATQEVPMPTEEEANYRIYCVDEITEICEEQATSAVKGELYSCLMEYRVNQLESIGESSYSKECEDSLYAKFRLTNADEGGTAATASSGTGPTIIETCTTPFRVRSLGLKNKCLQYSKTGKTSFKPCDMSSAAQHFLVRPAMQGGYRFIDVDRTMCLDEDMGMSDCGKVETTWNMNFADVMGGYQIESSSDDTICLGGAKEPQSGVCIKDMSAASGKGKAAKTAKQQLKMLVFAIEPAFGNELGFGVQNQN